MDDSATIFTILLIAGLVYWMWRANNLKKKPPPPPEPEGMTFTKGPGQVKPDTDPFLDALESEREAVERQARDERLAYKKEIETRIGDDDKLRKVCTTAAEVTADA